PSPRSRSPPVVAPWARPWCPCPGFRSAACPPCSAPPLGFTQPRAHHCQSFPLSPHLFAHLIRPSQERLRNRQLERPGRLEVDQVGSSLSLTRRQPYTMTTQSHRSPS